MTTSETLFLVDLSNAKEILKIVLTSYNWKTLVLPKQKRWVRFNPTTFPIATRSWPLKTGELAFLVKSLAKCVNHFLGERSDDRRRIRVYIRTTHSLFHNFEFNKDFRCRKALLFSIRTNKYISTRSTIPRSYSLVTFRINPAAAPPIVVSSHTQSQSQFSPPDRPFLTHQNLALPLVPSSAIPPTIDPKQS